MGEQITVVVNADLRGNAGIKVKTAHVASLPDGRLQFMRDSGFVWCEVAAGHWSHWSVVPDEEPTADEMVTAVSDAPD